MVSDYEQRIAREPAVHRFIVLTSSCASNNDASKPRRERPPPPLTPSSCCDIDIDFHVTLNDGESCESLDSTNNNNKFIHTLHI
jgi:hypothetical protein